MIRALAVLFLSTVPASLGEATTPAPASREPLCWARVETSGTVTWDTDVRCYTWENPIKILHGATEHHNTESQALAYVRN